MKQSLMYGFILNMWVMRKISEKYLDFAVKRKFITEIERVAIEATPRMDEEIL